MTPIEQNSDKRQATNDKMTMVVDYDYDYDDGYDDD